VIARLLVLLLALDVARAYAEPALDVPAALREANRVAIAGDWAALAELARGVLARPVAVAELAEAHRLAGIAAFMLARPAEAEAHFLAYLRVELDGRLDPALVPPDAVTFFNDVASRHAAELRARRPRPLGSWVLTLIPPAGQLQNGERTKAAVLGGLLGGLLVTNVGSYALLRAWCRTEGTAVSCDSGADHSRAAAILRPINLVAGVSLLLTYAFGVYDGVQGYRQRAREQAAQPFLAISPEAHVFGLSLRF
jgi:hypothetical protein